MVINSNNGVIESNQYWKMKEASKWYNVCND